LPGFFCLAGIESNKNCCKDKQEILFHFDLF
jgi:hypothetical protein